MPECMRVRRYISLCVYGEYLTWLNNESVKALLSGMYTVCIIGIYTVCIVGTVGLKTHGTNERNTTGS